MLNDYIKQREAKHKHNMKYVLMVLKGDNKYYYAHHCAKLCEWFENNGYYNTEPKDIERAFVSYNKYTGGKIVIKTKNGGAERTVKTFNDKNELLGYVVGFVESKQLDITPISN